MVHTMAAVREKEVSRRRRLLHQTQQDEIERMNVAFARERAAHQEAQVCFKIK